MDHDEDEDPTETPAGADWPTERVRIVGAEPASVLAGEHPAEPAEEGGADPADREQHYLGFVHHPTPPPPPLPPPPSDSGGLAGVSPELPHWSDPPTGQVPAIIDRRADEPEGEWPAMVDSGPVWREHEHEWDTGSFEPSMLADDQTPLGALDERPPEDRQPWEFDDLFPGDDEAEPGAEDAAGPPRTAEVDDPLRAAGVEDRSGRRGSSWGRRPTDFLSQRDDPFGVDDEERALFEPSSTVDGGPEAAVAQGDSPWWQDEPDADTTTMTRPAVTTPGMAGAPLGPRPQASDSGRTPRVRAPEGRAGESAPGGRNVPAAVATGVVALAVVFGCLALGPLATLVLATVGVTLAAAETYASFRRAGLHPATLLGLVATVAVMVSAYDKGVAALPLVGALVVVTAMLWYLVGAERGSPVVGVSSTVLGFAWVGILGSFAALLVAPSIYPHRHGVAFALGAVVATVAADVGALAVGSWLGRHQMAPHVSPNKTWEGWLGGAVLAVVASAFITGHVHPWTPGKAAILGAAVAVVAPMGDLCESLVKRDLGLKDMGSLLPGHGGVLDRMDALLFVLPTTYYLVRVLHLG